MPGSYSDLTKELGGLQDRSAAFDLCAFTRLSVGGKDAAELIRTALPESELAATESWSWGSNDKKIRILNSGNDYTLLIHPEISANMLERINNIAARFKVSLNDKTDKTAMIGIYGPESFETLDKIVPMSLDNLDPGSVMNVSFFMMNFTVVRGSWVGSDGVELICPVSASKFATQAIDKYQRQESIVPAGTVCFEAAFEEFVSQQA
jgi:glycine cleavage system aminomethyltransferase T